MLTSTDFEQFQDSKGGTYTATYESSAESFNTFFDLNFIDDDFKISFLDDNSSSYTYTLALTELIAGVETSLDYKCSMAVGETTLTDAFVSITLGSCENLNSTAYASFIIVTGNVGIGISQPEYALAVDGTIDATEFEVGDSSISYVNATMLQPMSLLVF